MTFMMEEVIRAQFLWVFRQAISLEMNFLLIYEAENR